jgi:hypothetical protein
MSLPAFIGYTPSANWCGAFKKSALVLLLLALAVSVSAGESIAKLQLHDGTILTNARIITFTGDNVTIVHSGGASVVRADLVDLETLARAKMRLVDVEAARKAKHDEATQKAATRKAQADQAKKEEIDIRLAMSAARGNTHADAPAVQPPTPPPASKSQGKSPKPLESIATLKASFPAKSPGNARVFIPKSGKNNKPYIVSSSVTQLPGGASYSRTTATHNAGEGRYDTIQYDAPSEEMWRWYRGMIQTTTPEALPRTLQMVDARIAEDTAKLQTAAGSLSPSAAAQAQHSLYWFDRTLAPYLAKWRAMVR